VRKVQYQCDKWCGYASQFREKVQIALQPSLLELAVGLLKAILQIGGQMAFTREWPSLMTCLASLRTLLTQFFSWRINGARANQPAEDKGSQLKAPEATPPPTVLNEL
jgi:hypothetical protein